MSSYANFRDPVGLVKRMLTSGNQAAWYALGLAGAGVLATPIDKLLAIAERRVMANADPDTLGPMVLIVGGSRSGTTITYQVLCRWFEVSWLDNLGAAFPSAALTVRRRNVGAEARGLDNYYGNTRGAGSPNDGFHVWNQWLGSDRYVSDLDMAQRTLPAMRRFFAAWAETFSEPFVNKNNRHVDALPFLSEALPTAKFLLVRRDPLANVSSLVTARRQVQGTEDAAWGTMASDASDSADPLAHIDAVCSQVLEVNRRLDEAAADLGERAYTLQLETLTSDAPGVLEQIRRWADLTPRGNVDLDGLASGAAIDLSPDERARAEALLNPI